MSSETNAISKLNCKQANTCRSNSPSVLLRLLAVLLCLAAVIDTAMAQPTAIDRDYREPAADITALLTAATPPEPLLHARSGQVALLFREPVISMDRLARPRLGLAGFRFDPEAGISAVVPLIYRIEIISANDPGQKAVVWQPAAGTVLDFVHFAPDGRTLSALAISLEGPARLVLFDIASGEAQTLDVAVNAAWGEPCNWIGAEELLCRVVPENRGAPPPEQPAPIVIEHSGDPMPMRTSQNLLENAWEDALFEYHFSVGLARVNRSGAVRPVAGLQGLISTVDPSPAGDYAVVTRILPPYSRLARANRFPSSVEVWDLARGSRFYASSPRGLGLETEAGEEDPRSAEWMPEAAAGGKATLGFIETVRDEDGNPTYNWMSLSAPFSGQPELVVSSAKRFQRFGWTSAGTPFFVTRGDTASEVSYQLVSNNTTNAFWTGIAADRYDNPGKAVRLDGSNGPALEVNGRIFIAGDGLSDQGPQPFLDVFDLSTQKIERVFTAEPGVYEVVLGILDPDQLTFVTSRETQTESPNLYRLGSGKRTALRPIPDPFPQLAGATRRVVTYTRADGVDLSGTLYLPEGYREGQPLPTLVWIYPTEFSDPEQAEQMDLRFFRFHKVKGPSPLAAVVAGYAVLLNPTVPILSDGAEPTDDYLPQLVASVEAAVDYLVESGISEPGRLAVAGRSYGAFSSANLLAHSDLFATAIAMSGAYNRTLTPFGFQHERRSFWDATDYYTSISPFFHANQINEPILLIHGGSDENPGTVPFGARRFFHALVGEGVTARYVELPYEGHHYWARENVLLAAAEMLDWLDRTIGPNRPAAEKPE
jgi:dipeptidyl aminopeptidase/acylaminoacyl peptidase